LLSSETLSEMNQYDGSAHIKDLSQNDFIVCNRKEQVSVCIQIRRIPLHIGK
uniref:SH2 domain-containing protein n=1 Tax=Brugia timori TaxID=42155 RepID=A0A0R3QAM6_9BILA